MKQLRARDLVRCNVRVRILEQDCTQPRPDNRVLALAADEKAMERMTRSYSKQASRSQQDYGLVLPSPASHSILASLKSCFRNFYWQTQCFMHPGEHSHGFMLFLAPKHCPGHFWALSLTNQGTGLGVPA